MMGQYTSEEHHLQEHFLSKLYAKKKMRIGYDTTHIAVDHEKMNFTDDASSLCESMFIQVVYKTCLSRLQFQCITTAIF